jgi:MFS transporter, DHA2 family, multidrug resistance protein
MINSSNKYIIKKAYSPWLIAFVVMLPTAMEVLDTSIANVVLPYIAGDLGVSVDKSTWIITSYLVANAIILPITGWLSNILGRRTYFLLSILIFTISSLMCGLSTSLNELLFFRALQGLGGGGLLPLSQAILLEHFPDEKRAIGMGIYGMGVILAPIFGPMLGGWIADNYSWGWIFLINIPVGLISMGLVYLFIEQTNVKKEKEGRFSVDYIGLGALSIGIASLQVFLDKGQRYDWFSSGFITSMFILAIVSLTFVVIWEIKCRNPIIDLRMLKDKNFLAGVISMFVVGMVFYSITEVIPMMLQTLIGYTAFLSGLVIAVSGIPVFFAMPTAGILCSKYSPKWIIMCGWCIAIFALYKMTLFNLNIGFWNVAHTRAIMGLGIAFIFVPMNTVAFMFIKKDKIEYGTGFINLMRNIGGSVGIASINTIIARKEQIHQSYLTENINPLNTVFIETFQTIKDGLQLSTQQAMDLIYLSSQQQAEMLSYLDGFRALFLIMIITLPILFIIKNNKNKGGI